MKMKELRQKNIKELRDLLNADCEKLGKLRFELKSKKLKNTCEISKTRRGIARLLMLLSK